MVLARTELRDTVEAQAESPAGIELPPSHCGLLSLATSCSPCPFGKCGVEHILHIGTSGLSALTGRERYPY